MEKFTHPITGDPVWHLNSSKLDDVEEFISEHYYGDFQLSIFDVVSGSLLDIDCSVSEINSVLSCIMAIEKSKVLFVGLNSVSHCYTAVLAFEEGMFEPGYYEYKNNVLSMVMSVDECETLCRSMEQEYKI